MMFKRKTMYGAILAASAIAHTHAQIEEVIVTATKREASAQDIPIALAALGEQALDRLGITDFSDYLVQLPGVTAGGTGPGINTIYIRGVASTTPNLAVAGVAGLAPNVAIYLDEQPLAMPGRNLDVYAADLNRVEVLKGPQGTLFGASSQAGNVRLITNKPDMSGIYGKVKLATSYTPEGEPGHKAEGTINLPLTDNFAVRGVVYSDHQGGYIDNVRDTRSTRDSHRFSAGGSQQPNLDLTGVTFINADNGGLVEDDFNETTWSGARLSALWNINDNWQLLLGASQQTIETDGVFFMDPELDDLEISRFSSDTFEDSYENFNWTLTGRLGALDVIYTGAYTDWEVDGIIDYTDYLFIAEFLPYYICDYRVTHDHTSSDAHDDHSNFDDKNMTRTPTPAKPSGTCYSPATVVPSSVNTEVQTHELRIQTDQSQRVRAVAGAFYSDMELRELNNFTFSSGELTLDADENHMMRGWGPNYSAVGATTQLKGQWHEGVIWRNDVLRTDEQLGVFGEVSFDLFDQFQVALGARWYDIEVDLLGSAAGSWGNRGQTRDMNVGNNLDDIFSVSGKGKLDKAETDGVIGKVSLSWTPNADQLYYLTWAEGFRAGILNRPGGDKRTCLDDKNQRKENCELYTVPFAVDTDEVVSYELGWKLDLQDNTLRFNGNIFYIDVTDLQVTIFDPEISNLFFSDNAADAEVMGVEGDFIWVANPNLTLGGGFAFLDTEITASHVTQFVRKGDDLAFAPEFQFNLNARYEWSLPNGRVAHLTPSVSYSDKVNTDIVETKVMELDSWSLFNLAVGVSDEKWTAELYIENLTDERAEISGSFQYEKPRVTVARPLTIGVRYDYKF